MIHGVCLEESKIDIGKIRLVTVRARNESTLDSIMSDSSELRPGIDLTV